MVKIGVLDSGIGGLTTVSCILKKVRNAQILYYADNGAGGYGDKDKDEIFAFVHKGLKKLFSSGAEICVVACNTATVTVLDDVRKKFRREIVGTEPAVKLARGNAVALVTEATARSLRYKKLASAAAVQTVAMPDLAALIESGPEHFAEAVERVEKALSGRVFDSLVLGCTHYVFLRPLLEKRFPYVYITDGNEGVAARTLRLVRDESENFSGEYRVKFFFSGENRVEQYRNLLACLM